MIKSMTAFARSERTDGPRTVSCEIRSYNSRHLDLALRMPHGYAPLEERCKVLVGERISRGRVEAAVKIRDESEETYVYEVNLPAARAYHQALTRLGETLGVADAVSLDLLAGASGVIRPAEVDKDLDACWPLLRDGLVGALDDLDAMRRREGEFIARDLAERLAAIETDLAAIGEEAGGLLSLYQERLKERIAALTQNMVEIDPTRLAQEVAFLADRSDISEEILRATSHLEQFRLIMGSPEPGGRKLNFLLQEFNREFNTIGSKTSSSQIAHRVVAVKSELEKIREQVQNIE